MPKPQVPKPQVPKPQMSRPPLPTTPAEVSAAFSPLPTTPAEVSAFFDGAQALAAVVSQQPASQSLDFPSSAAPTATPHSMEASFLAQMADVPPAGVSSTTLMPDGVSVPEGGSFWAMAAAQQTESLSPGGGGSPQGSLTTIEFGQATAVGGGAGGVGGGVGGVGVGGGGGGGGGGPALSSAALVATSQAFDDLYKRGMAAYKGKAYMEAEDLFREALRVKESFTAPDDPQLAVVYNNLAATLEKRGQPREAEALYHQAIAICEMRLPSNHPRIEHIRKKLTELQSSLFAFPGLAPAAPRSIDDFVSE